MLTAELVTMRMWLMLAMMFSTRPITGCPVTTDSRGISFWTSHKCLKFSILTLILSEWMLSKHKAIVIFPTMRMHSLSVVAFS